MVGARSFSAVNVGRITPDQPPTAVALTDIPTRSQSSLVGSAEPRSDAARLAFTSYLRVAAIIGVVLIHTAGLTYVNDDLRYTMAWWVASLGTVSTKWAVPVFVMVSGALLLRAPADRSAVLFYRRRLSRIAVPLVVWHAFYITLNAHLLTNPDPRRILASFLRGESYTGSYFFWLILGLYLITPLLWPLASGSSRRALGLVGALLVAAAAANLSALRLIGRLEGGSSPAADPTMLTQFVPYVGFFLLGFALRDVVVRGRGRVTALAVVSAALVLEPTWQLTGPFFFGTQTADRLNVLTPVSYQGWGIGLASVAVFLLARAVIHPASRWAQPPAARWARVAGDLSLGVFATHIAVLTLLRRVPGHGWPEGAKTLTQLGLLCTATLVGAVALTLVLRRLPLLRRTV